MSDNKLATKSDLQEMYNRIYPYLGGMPEVLANKFSKGDLYSTDEKMIGQWIDGKPLYAKTINTGALSNAPNKKVAHSISNLGEIVSMLATYHRTDGKWFQISNVHLKAANKTLQLSITTTIVEIDSDSGDYSDVDKSYVTLQYTKTTDTAISIGSDTDYSTEEKIVGTWIDGKPVYQKVVTDLNLSMTWYQQNQTQNSSFSLPVEKSNLGQIINVRGMNSDGSVNQLSCEIGSTSYLIGCSSKTINTLIWEYTKKS